MVIIGLNGTGKTTSTKKVVHGNPGISLSPSAEVGYSSQKINMLELDKNTLENVQSSLQQSEALTQTILTRTHFFRDDVYKPMSVLSGGERVKVALTKAFLSEVNTLVLDEPTDLLDVGAIETLKSLLKECNDSIIFTSHDRKFIERVATRVMTIDNKEIKISDGTYEQFKQTERPTRSTREDKRLLLETKVTEVFSRLSIEPSEELGQESQNLINEKRNLDK